MEIKKFKLTSDVFKVRPKESTVTTRVGNRWFKFTTMKTYYVARIDYSIRKSEESVLFIIDDPEKGLRAFPVVESFAKNKFRYISEYKIPDQVEFISRFNQHNIHVTDEYQFKLEF